MFAWSTRVKKLGTSFGRGELSFCGGLKMGMGLEQARGYKVDQACGCLVCIGFVCLI